MGKKSSEPENITEAALCRIMADVLKLGSVGAEDDFFELGGDSFLALEFMAKAENEGLTVPVSSIYEHPTARSLSEEITAGILSKENIMTICSSVRL